MSDGDSLLEILGELNELVGSARAMPMSASALINRAEVMDLISSAREVLPEQIAQADKIRSEAETILEHARREAETLVAQEAVVKAAEDRASHIIEQAEIAAQKLAQDADEYCDRILAEFEIDLGKISSQVAAGRTRLQERNPGDDQ